jgi:hypothetical protein
MTHPTEDVAGSEHLVQQHYLSASKCFTEPAAALRLTLFKEFSQSIY